MKPSTSTVTSTVIGVPLAVILSWLCKTFGHIDVPGTVEAALGALLSAGIGYFFNGGKAVDTTPPDETDQAAA